MHKTISLSVGALLLTGTMGVSERAEATTGTLFLTADTTLTEDHFGNIVLDADGITLDCAGLTVTGSGTGTGILLNSRTGVTIKHCHVTSFNQGFSIEFSSQIILTGNTADASTVGFAMGESRDSTLRGNSARSNSDVGFFMLLSTGNLLEGNTADNGGIGFFFLSSSDNVATRNTAKGNVGDGFSLQGVSDGNLLTGNDANGNGDHGFRLTSTGTVGNTFERNGAKANGEDGFALLAAANHELARNTANKNGRHGFNLDSATNNVLTRNKACKNGTSGVGFDAINLGGSGNVMRRTAAKS